MLNIFKPRLRKLGSLEGKKAESHEAFNKSYCHPKLVSGSNQCRMTDKNNCVKLECKFPAFTLAEVLITLVIIGVIAAITVPAMIQQTQKQEYVSGLKKAHSTLKNALYLITANNGYPQGDYIFLKNVDFIDEFAKVANVVKTCTNTAACFPSSIRGGNTVYTYLNGSSSTHSDGRTVITNDGQMYTAYKLSSSSSKFGLTSEDGDNSILRIIVDLNGWKKPNKIGYDVFLFYIVDGKGVIPAGAHETADCNKSSYGRTCAAKVLKESKIDY